MTTSSSTSPVPVALITGAARRVGRSIALALAERGYDIVIHYHRSEESARALVGEIEAYGRRAVAIAAHLEVPAQIDALVPRATELLGAPLTLLVNNASHFARDTLADASYEGFLSHQQVNLYAPMALSQAFAAQLPASAAGQIINLSDGVYGWSMSPHFLTYSLSKFGLLSLTELLASSLAPKIRVNAIALGPTLPGVMDTPGTFEKLARLAPLKRVSAPEEVVAAMDYLLTAPSVTGQVLYLSGGMQLGGVNRPEVTPS
jgi:NAD(P)-dependent dehydrogenase (short-subunit alcohol dehydrogenase family)